MQISGMIKCALVATFVLAAGPVTADDDTDKKMSRSEKAIAKFYNKYEEGDGSKRCIPARQIHSTKALSDELIHFDMRGSKSYVNKLPRKCHGLFFENRFMYKLHGAQLCSIDLITVLDGFGRERMTCGLGDFVEVTEKDKDDKAEKSE